MKSPKKPLRRGRPPRPAEKSVRITITVPPWVAVWAEGLYDNYNRHRATRKLLLREYDLYHATEEEE